MQSVVVGVASVLLLCGAVAAIGPPPGSRGTLDFRYPDYIVDPLVPCPFEGVFPHPRNCTWYYRCYDRYGLGFFWRAYFECEPGTVFSDALDQCIWGSINENCAPGLVTPPYPGSVTLTPPTQPPPVVTCQDVVQQCGSQALCPTSVGPTSMHVLMEDVCVVAERQCSDGSRQPLCKPGELYFTERRRCDRSDGREVCLSTPRPISPLVCEEVVKGCTNSYICDSPIITQTVSRCQITKLCSRDGVEVSRTPLCPVGQSFDPLSNMCAPDVIEFTGCPSHVVSSGSAPQPVCRLQTETCQELPVCGRSDGQMAASCKQFFSCDGLWRSTTRNAASYPAAARSCIDVPEEPSCEENCAPEPTQGPPTQTPYPPGGITLTPPTPTSNPGPTPRPTPPPTLAPPVVTCLDVVQQCGSQALCPTSVGPTSMHVLLENVCAVAERQCSDGSRQPLCQPGEVYFTERRRCDRSDGREVCLSTPRPTSPLVCEEVVKGCTNSYICDSPIITQTVSRCQITKLCSRDGVEVSRTPLCPVGQSFDPLSNMCAPDVIEFTGCPSHVVSSGSAPQPVCRLQTETCQELPVCGRSDGQMAASCKQFFSCDGLWRSTTRNAASYPAAVRSCIEVPEAPSCESSFSSCHQVAFCPPDIDMPFFVPRVRVCEEATRVCSDGTSAAICPPGLIYDVDQQQCRDNSSICLNAVRPLAPIYCEDIIESCQDQFICPNTPDIPEMVRRCDIFQVCYKNSQEVSRTSVCQPGQKFDAVQNICVLDDAGSYPCGPAVSSLPPSTVSCGMDGEQCTMTPICDSLDSSLVCRRYFSCSFNAPPAAVTVPRQTGYPSSAPTCLPLVIAEPPQCSEEPQLASCQQEAICPAAFGSSQSSSSLAPSSLFVQSLEVCREAFRTCFDGTQTSLCAIGEIYIKDRQQCWKGSDLCQAPNQRPPSPIVCEDVLEGCNDSYVCRTNPHVAEVVRRCDLSTVCLQDGVEISRQTVCPGGKFDSRLNQCVIDSPGVYECTAGAVARPLPQPVCQLESEACQQVPVCQTQHFALQCRQLFSCTPALSASIVSRRMSTFGVGLRAAARDDVCVPITALLPPITPPAPPTCQERFTLNDCRLQALCPNDQAYQSSLFVEKVEVCSVARADCTDGTQRDTCGPGEVYYVVAKTCLAESTFCRDPEPRPITPLMCEDTIENCQDSYWCPNSPLEPSLLRRCDLFRTCYRDGAQITKQSLCPNGKFDASLNQCVDNAPGIYECAGKPTDPPPPVCGVVSESCSDSPVCQAQDTVLVCKRLFACEDYSPSVTRNAYRPENPACTELPGFGPETCEITLSGCQAWATCPADWDGLASQIVPVLQLCNLAEKVCSGGTRTPLCPAGDLYDDAEQSCVSQANLCVPEQNPRPPSPLVCEDMLVQCTDSYICPNTPDVPELVRRCTLNRACTRDGKFVSQTPLCPDGDFDAFLNQCVPPIPASSQCPGAVAPSSTPQPQCREETERCTNTPVCNDQEYGLLCRKLFSCSFSFGFRARNFFPRQESECLEAGGIDNTLNETIPITCNFEDEIPMTAAIKKRFCPSEAMCKPPFSFVDMREACQEFYRCKMVGGTLRPSLETCPPGQVLLPATKTCVQENTEDYRLCSSMGTPASPTETPLVVVEITTLAPEPTPPKEEFPKNWNTTLECTRDKEIPVNDVIKKVNCDSTPLCTDGTFVALEELCRRFYVCRWDGTHFVIDESECTSGLLFSYKQSKCVQPSSNVCVRFLRQP